MDALLDTIKFFIIGFAIGWMWEPILKYTKMFYHGFKEMLHEWNNPKGK
jgi:hypothetical protein